jgi:hypothetical protein
MASGLSRCQRVPASGHNALKIARKCAKVGNVGILAVHKLLSRHIDLPDLSNALE